ncbi:MULTISPECIES: NIPSNAP family protein [unclassified Streptomyces]|uniref:NIPSNAP family protein n=1 Tax=unclassified Streptomyces TaxID=2593676 RepID=UPI002DDB76E0|nr:MULTISPECIES: NIPSNAP family protein [unclassified Streptomyces]WSA94622.1 NIPSNAP family protein [Streptomyces sp. NBC_01795]WSB79042.1 NIPSNAP family protein [Streptomyces sp. NBC_01775]WSS41541.1 NIPSNAP family protein [Streptomyces sp. NBC_01187]
MPPTDPDDRPTVIELRQYTLRPGRRDEFIELFDQEFIETQEQTGMTVLGQFRDLDDPDRFVWLRGFRDMAARHQALTAFYGGPVWAEHGPQANAAMIDSDNVLLLRPLSAEDGFAVSPAERPHTTVPAPDRFVAATVWSFPPGQPDGVELIRDGLLPVLHKTGPAPLAVLTTETAHNSFSRLPVRAGENVVAVFTSYPDETAHRRHVAETGAQPDIRDKILPGIEREQTAAPQTLRLAPTGRSLIR